jgi:hypothetical protein
MRKILKEEFIAKVGKFFPPETIDFVFLQFETNSFSLKITRPRITKKGDFRYSLIHKFLPVISINCNLCQYEFFLVFLHELAHFKVFNKYENQAKSHGKEWKSEYKKLLAIALNNIDFPSDIQDAFYKHLGNIKSSSALDHDLEAVFDFYRVKIPDMVFVKNLNPGDHFICKNEMFVMDSFVRTRARCTMMKSRRKYLISGLMKVKLVSDKSF